MNGVADVRAAACGVSRRELAREVTAAIDKAARHPLLPADAVTALQLAAALLERLADDVTVLMERSVQ